MGDKNFSAEFSEIKKRSIKLMGRPKGSADKKPRKKAVAKKR